MGIVFGFVGSGVVDDFDGVVEFVVVLVEEYFDFDYWCGLFDVGDIEFFGGK